MPHLAQIVEPLPFLTTGIPRHQMVQPMGRWQYTPAIMDICWLEQTQQTVLRTEPGV